jgi:hypothetical protein
MIVNIGIRSLRRLTKGLAGDTCNEEGAKAVGDESHLFMVVIVAEHVITISRTQERK